VLNGLRERSVGTRVQSPILDETIAAVADILGSELGTITIERAVIGLFFTGVKLSSGEAGACATPREAVPEGVCCPLSAGKAPFRALHGRAAAELMRDAAGPEGLARAVGIATLNALAERCWTVRPHPEMELRPAVDAFDATDIHAGEQIVLVGAFIPFLKELKRRRLAYLVLEQNPAALKGEELPFYRPAEAAGEVVPQAEVLLITGATLLNDTLEDLLALARPGARVAVVGPTVGLLPDRLSPAAPISWARCGSAHRTPFSTFSLKAAPHRISSAALRKRSCSPGKPLRRRRHKRRSRSLLCGRFATRSYDGWQAAAREGCDDGDARRWCVAFRRPRHLGQDPG